MATPHPITNAFVHEGDTCRCRGCGTEVVYCGCWGNLRGCGRCSGHCNKAHGGHVCGLCDIANNEIRRVDGAAREVER